MWGKQRTTNKIKKTGKFFELINFPLQVSNEVLSSGISGNPNSRNLHSQATYVPTQGERENTQKERNRKPQTSKEE